MLDCFSDCLALTHAALRAHPPPLTASPALISPAVPIPPSDSVLCSCYLKLNLAISWQPLPWLLPAPHTTAPLVSQELQSRVCHVLPLACLQWIKDKSSMWTHTCISKNKGKVMALENEGHCKFAGWGVFHMPSKPLRALGVGVTYLFLCSAARAAS